MRARLALLVLLLLPAAGSAAEPHEGRHAHESHGTAPMAPAAAPPHSIYVLESAWQTGDGRTLRLGALAGQPVVLAMVYTHCEHACPRIIADMRRVRAELRAAGDRVHFVLASLDPERDTVARLHAFAEIAGLGPGWLLVRSGPGEVRELAAALGIRFRRVGERDFVHSNLLSVLDAEGRVVHRQIGLGVDPDATVEVLRGLLSPEGEADPD